MTADPPVSQSFGERRGHHLAPLQTNFSRPTAGQPAKPTSSRLRRARPTDSDYGPEAPRVPLQPKRQTSKTSLRGLFGGRDKSSQAAAPQLDSKLAEIDEAERPDLEVVSMSEAPLSSPPCPTPRTATSTPGLTSPIVEHKVEHKRHRNTLKSPRARTFEQKPPSQEQYGWKPPPLFQAYPQSIKHECLPAPALSADSILRLNAAAGKGTVDDNRSGDDRKKEQRERKHQRTVSSTMNKVEWSRKIFVLATAGFILQYGAQGKHDRLPEKMLQLGPQSVAFASDAIPGKHWVVQISQNPAADAATPPGPEPSKSRFSLFQRSQVRRFTRSMLLVFDNPDAMISWLMAIRTEIEARGGPKLPTEKHSEDEFTPQLRPRSSVRQIVQKDPNRVSSVFLQPQMREEEEDLQSVGGLTLPSRSNSYMSDIRRSMVDVSSVSTGPTEATAPTNGAGSFTSNDPRTPSFTSANPTSPIGPSSPVAEDRLVEIDRTNPRSPSSSVQGKRQSLLGSPYGQFTPTPRTVDASQTTPRPDTLIRCASPPAPNFSVPSFSKKFVARPGPTPINQFSPPSSAAGFLPASTFSSSPPHSEDALTKTLRSSHAPTNFSRVPRSTAPGSPDSSSSFTQRPVSVVMRPGMKPQVNSETRVQTLSPPPEPIPRPRGSALYAESQAQSVSRRKSMPGLLVGPPAAPPPNCPLPKIPSPISAQAQAPAPWSSSPPPPQDRFYGLSDVRERVDQRKSTFMSGPKIASPRLR
ncbi:hypothetical protein N7474_011195 [Penicillium riverlandense]|uniref:uncharacterized protein n=1 Tax=Penicillium riverlandense TaxID=1903569 RepID=UPI002547D758|nr:uncharacterized protein N7474_011195 [Penicillium riverlandense]KAJ5805308.1 hypothetical protein N7474_011195 [Penicillium riverlandense]